MEGGSSRQGVRLSHSVAGSMLTQTSFSLLTIYICVCVCVCSQYDQLKCLTASDGILKKQHSF